jgi:hypothetical protein
MPLRPFTYSFNGGEVSPRFEGRADHQRYFSSLRICENFVVNPIGNADRRPGTRFIAQAKWQFQKIRLVPFKFSVNQAYAVEMGHEYLRFYRTQQRIENPPGTPVEVASPYQESDLFGIQFAQQQDVMWQAHPAYAPRKLLRFSDTQWTLPVIPFDPPPSVEEPITGGVPLTLGATTGASVFCLATESIFLDADVGREISLLPAMGTQARATILSLNSPSPTTSVNVNILQAFPSTFVADNTWQLDGPLGSGIHIGDGTGLRGTLLKVTLRQRDINRPELIANGNFTSGLDNWTNHSDIVLASGSHTGGSGSVLQDISKHFPALSTRIGMRLINVSGGTQGTVNSITPDGRSLASAPPGITFNAGNTYEVRGTGGVQVASGGAQFSGGNAGIGWLSQGFATINGETYQVLFDVEEGPIAAQVGTESTLSNLFSEASFPIGKDQEVIFVASGPGAYIQFRNNQPTMTRIKNVRAKSISAHGLRASDVGSFIKTRNGVLEVAGLDNPHSANVIVRSPMEEPTEADVVAGAWTLEVPAWSTTRGFPRAVVFHQQRLAYAGTALQPLTVWQSEIREYEHFGASALADSALEQEFSAENNILWMQTFRDMLVGTEETEHLLHGVNGPLTPANAEQLPQTSVGSDGLPPLRLHNALMILARGGRTIVELKYDENGAVVQERNHTLLAEHISAGGIVQWAIQTKPSPIIWAVRGDGRLIGLTYEQFEQVQGWHRHVTDGLFESVCVVPKADPVDEYTEDVYVAVVRDNASGPHRSIERLDQTLTLDSAVSYSGPATTTITGLSHLEGKTVSVIDKSAGDDQPAMMISRVVTGGQITGLEHSVTVADVGLNYPATLRTLRPEVPTREGTLQGRRKKWDRIFVRCLNTGGFQINGIEAVFREPEDLMDEGLVLRSGDFEAKDEGWTRDGYVTITQTQPLPMTAVAAFGELNVGED